MVLGLVAGCGGGASAQKPNSVVSFDVANFKIAGPAQLKSGVVEFDLHGLGPTMHEFNVARTDMNPKELPLADDGTVDDQNVHSGFVHVAEREGIDMGRSASLTVALQPGHYVLYCNMDGHYKAGMNLEVIVS